jgi:hypothetical protein
MAELFGRERSVITKHVRNVFREGELDPKSVCAEFAHTAADGKTYQVEAFNLDVIISVGYRVKFVQGTRFRIWATQVLREHLVRGYTVNAQRLHDLNQAVRLVAAAAAGRDLSGNESQALLDVVGQYSRALELLDDYDHQRVSKPAAGGAQADDRREPPAGEGRAGAHRDAPADRRCAAVTPTDTSERGLERQICTAPTADPCDPGAVQRDIVQERPAVQGAGWVQPLRLRSDRVVSTYPRATA